MNIHYSYRTGREWDARTWRTDRGDAICHHLHKTAILILSMNGRVIINTRKPNFETIRGSLMKPKWQKLASLAQEICTL